VTRVVTPPHLPTTILVLYHQVIQLLRLLACGCTSPVIHFGARHRGPQQPIRLDPSETHLDSTTVTIGVYGVNDTFELNVIVTYLCPNMRLYL
jgi:hypothetical protein